MKIPVTSVYVADQGKTLRFDTEVLGLRRKSDIPLGDARWLTVTSSTGDGGVELLLQPATTAVAISARGWNLITAVRVRPAELSGAQARLGVSVAAGSSRNAGPGLGHVSRSTLRTHPELRPVRCRAARHDSNSPSTCRLSRLSCCRGRSSPRAGQSRRWDHVLGRRARPTLRRSAAS